VHRVTARCCFLLVAAFCALSASSVVAADDDAAKAKAEKAVIKPTKVIRQPPVQAVRVLDDNSVLVVHSHVTGLDQLFNKKAAVDGKRSSAPGRFGWSKWELSSGRQLHSVTKELPFAVQGAIVSPDGSWVGVYGLVFDQQTETPTSASVAVWDTKSGRKISAWKVFGAFIFDVAVAPSGKRIVLATQKVGSDVNDLDALASSVQIWRVSKGKHERTLLDEKRGVFPTVGFDRKGDRLWVCAGRFAMGSKTTKKSPPSKNFVLVWRTRDWKQIRRVDFPDGPFARPIPHLIGSRIFALSRGFLGSGGMELWDLQTGAKLKTFEFKVQPSAFVSSLSPDGKRLAFLNQVGSSFTLSKRVNPPKVIYEIAVVDIQSGTVIARLREPKSRATAFSFTKDGRQIISGSSDGSIRIWKLPAAR